MSKSRFTEELNSALKTLEVELSGHRGTVTDTVVAGTYSQESAGVMAKNIGHETNGIRSTVVNTLKELLPELSTEAMADFSDISESMKAGVIAYLASQEPTEYNKSALGRIASDGSVSLEGLMSGIGGEIETLSESELSMEAFDSTPISNYAPQNIVFNVLASRQDPFAEGFFPTKVLAASEGGLKITVDRQEAIDLATHDRNGNALNDNRRNLIDAYADAELLNRPATELVPYKPEDGSADANFVAAADVAPTVAKVSGHSIRTAPLKMGRSLNLKGVSQHPGLLDNNLLTSDDQIAPGMKLVKLYLKGTHEANSEVFSVDTQFLGRNQFKKSHEGQGREVVLNFITKAIPFSKMTKTIAGDATALYDAIPDNYTVSLKMSVTGNGNLDSGMIELNSSSITVAAIADADGKEVSLTEGQGADIVALFEARPITAIGYNLSARRSNSNWRSTGLIIDVTPYTESHAIMPGYPISVRTPTDENQNGAKISGMVNAARIRNSNNAVTTLINYGEMLENYQTALKSGVRMDIYGAARHIVKPYYNFTSVDVEDALSNMTSTGRVSDVSNVIVNAIRDEAYRMYRESNYGPALDLAHAGTVTKPKVVIGCDEVVKRYLQMVANESLLGEHMDYEIVGTNDSRMKDQIYMSFTRNRPGSDDGLTFGVHAYVPELIQRVVTSHNNSTVKNDRVIPHNLHIPVLPVLTRLEVVKLKEAVQNLK